MYPTHKPSVAVLHVPNDNSVISSVHFSFVWAVWCVVRVGGRTWAVADKSSGHPTTKSLGVAHRRVHVPPTQTTRHTRNGIARGTDSVAMPSARIVERWLVLCHPYPPHARAMRAVCGCRPITDDHTAVNTTNADGQCGGNQSNSVRCCRNEIVEKRERPNLRWRTPGPRQRRESVRPNVRGDVVQSDGLTRPYTPKAWTGPHTPRPSQRWTTVPSTSHERTRSGADKPEGRWSSPIG